MIHVLLERIFPPFEMRKGEPTVEALVIKQLSFERITESQFPNLVSAAVGEDPDSSD